MSEMYLNVDNNRKTALVIDERDNVAIALTDLVKGDKCIVRSDEQEELIVILDDIPFGHKFALVDLNTDAPVYKYGEEIGRMREAILRGGWIHSHNMYCERGMKNGR